MFTCHPEQPRTTIIINKLGMKMNTAQTNEAKCADSYITLPNILSAREHLAYARQLDGRLRVPGVHKN